MKRGKKNNAFTEALGAEISTRKILEKAQDNAENKILLKDLEMEFEPEVKDEEKPDWWVAEPIDSSKPIPQSTAKAEKKSSKQEKNKKISAKKVKEKKSAKKIPEQTFHAPVKVEAETDFEKKVFAEAENDFYDEIISEPEDKKKSSTFHDKKIKNRVEAFAEENFESNDENERDYDPELHRKLTRTERAGVGVSALMMIYAFTTLDKPLFFIALSLFVHLMRPLVGVLCGKHNRAVQNAMRSFSIVLFVGALVIWFMMR